MIRLPLSGLLFIGICGLTAVGCGHTDPKHNLRPVAVEEFALPPTTDRRYSEPPVYEDSKREIGTSGGLPMKAPNVPAAGRGAGPGGGGGGRGGAGQQAGLTPN